jgi:pimeloyl-ACP methyl ester carboxylesterase
MTPLVLLHAFPLSSSMYDDVLAMIDHPTLAPDLPGFGASVLSDAEPDLDVYADFVVDQMDRAGMARAVVAGTSMGGYTAMAMWRRHPERVAGLALIDTKASADSREAAEGRRTMATTMEEHLTSEPLLEGVFPKLLGSTTFSSRPDIEATVRGWVTAVDPRAAAWAQRAMAVRPDSFATLRSVDVPANVLVGAEDVLSPPTDAHAMAQALPDATLVTVPEAGHLTPVESPADVATALQRLLARADG